MQNTFCGRWASEAQVCDCKQYSCGFDSHSRNEIFNILIYSLWVNLGTQHAMPLEFGGELATEVSLWERNRFIVVLSIYLM